MTNVENPELRLAEGFVKHTHCHVYLTGKAGTGKTTFLHTIKDQTNKRLVVTAPTGVAAINAGGVTLHSFFQIPFGPFIPEGEAHLSQHRFRRDKKNIIRSLDLLIIDEISMVRADLLDSVDRILRRYRHSDQPFGDVQLLMIGDLQQLSPVVKRSEWQILEKYYDTPYFFSSTALGRSNLVPIELKHIYRQSDPRFIKLLNRVRNNRLDPAALKLLHSRYIPNFRPPQGKGYITLCTHNRSADAINQERLKALGGKRHRFDAEINGDFPEHAYPTATTLELKIGAQVMFVRNDNSVEKSYFNGKTGELVGMSDTTIAVCCPGDSDNIIVENVTWENIEYTVDPKTAEIEPKVVGTFSQFPLKLAWAITIHKSQGLTFDSAIIDARAAFAHGHVYVALSRCRTLEGIVLSSPIPPSAVKMDNAVQRFEANATGNQPTTERLATEKIRYQQLLLLACFSFGRLCRRIGRLTALVRNNEKGVQVSGGCDLVDIRQRAETEICEVGEKFKRQLQGMFIAGRPPATIPAILKRLAKAAPYFQTKFEELLSQISENFAFETDNQEVRKKINTAAKQVSEETAVKIAGVLSCQKGFSPGRYLRAISIATIRSGPSRNKSGSVVFTEADVGYPELYEILRQWRAQKADAEDRSLSQIIPQKTLVQIAVHLPDSMGALKKIKGIGNRLAKRYGSELVALSADFRRKHRIKEVKLPKPAATALQNKGKSVPKKKGDSKKITLEMFKQDPSISKIAAGRRLAVSTIEKHITYFVSKGEVAVGMVVADEKRRAIEAMIAKTHEKTLKTLKTALGDDYSYKEIKMVLAHLEYVRQ